MMKVQCIKGREKMLSKVEVGKIYFLDMLSVYGDSDGDWFGKIYADESKKQYIANMKLSHFKSI